MCSAEVLRNHDQEPIKSNILLFMITDEGFFSPSNSSVTHVLVDLALTSEGFTSSSHIMISQTPGVDVAPPSLCFHAHIPEPQQHGRKV